MKEITGWNRSSEFVRRIGTAKIEDTAPPLEIPKMVTSLAKGSSGDFYWSESLVWVLERTLLCLGVAGVAGMHYAKSRKLSSVVKFEIMSRLESYEN
jgi:hypothetical protein